MGAPEADEMRCCKSGLPISEGWSKGDLRDAREYSGVVRELASSGK